ncbi:MAG TPA: OmpH family outer membrane protein [Candidatus Limnocylindrales bacterium]|jgi:outer membrane protein|nr:OmpH family outer membrane protein [Candidatus Limnocylindrales bacterium]
MSFKLTSAVSACLLFMGTAALGSAQQAATGPQKVGIANIQAAIISTNEGKKEAEAVEQRFASRQSQLRAENDAIEKMKQELQTQGDKLSESERNSRVATLQTRQKTFQRSYEDYGTEVQQAENEVLNRLAKKMIPIMQKYAKDNGYSVILDVSNEQSTPVLWAAPSTNVTKELVEAYNAENKTAAPAQPKPAATRPAAPPAKKP